MTGHRILSTCYFLDRKARNKVYGGVKASCQCLSGIPAAHPSILPGLQESTFCKQGPEDGHWVTLRACCCPGCVIHTKEEPCRLIQQFLFTHQGIPDSRPSPPLKLSNTCKCSFVSSQLHMAYATGLTKPKHGYPSASWQQVCLQSVAMKTALQWSRQLPQTGLLGANWELGPQHQMLLNANFQPAARAQHPGVVHSKHCFYSWFSYFSSCLCITVNVSPLRGGHRGYPLNNQHIQNTEN